MSKPPQILAIDQGTTSTRAIVFDSANSTPLASSQQEFEQIYPQPGWVEHDPEAIWETSLATVRDVLQKAGPVAAFGITNQRETTVVWDRATGTPIHNAIVWQDRRTARLTSELKADEDTSAMVRDKTGLVCDPYFSATKIAWILDHVDGARARAEAGELAFGTIDTFLLWRFTGGKVHATDASNASRTLLYDITAGEWDRDLLELFKVPTEVLPEVRDSAGDFGHSCSDVLGSEIPITGIAGDQQAAAFGQACFKPGMIKSTYGTGCFVLANTGSQIPRSDNGLLSTVAYQLGGERTYALEGSIFIAGAAVQWLRDSMGLVPSAPDTEQLAAGLPDNGGVYLVPAFTGLGAPHWAPDARAAAFGMTRDTGYAHFARAALESVAYQTADLLDAMRDDGLPVRELRIDGGMSANNWLADFLADILDLTISRPKVIETTALGATYLAGLGAGIYSDLDQIATRWTVDADFTPSMDASERLRLLDAWHRAVEATLSF